MALEMLEQVPDLDAAVIPVGGGGMLAGCAMAFKMMKPDVRIIVSVHLSAVAKTLVKVKPAFFSDRALNPRTAPASRWP